jgi:hypothetical protein
MLISLDVSRISTRVRKRSRRFLARPTMVEFASTLRYVAPEVK